MLPRLPFRFLGNKEKERIHHRRKKHGCWESQWRRKVQPIVNSIPFQSGNETIKITLFSSSFFLFFFYFYCDKMARVKGRGARLRASKTASPMKFEPYGRSCACWKLEVLYATDRTKIATTTTIAHRSRVPAIALVYDARPGNNSYDKRLPLLPRRTTKSHILWTKIQSLLDPKEDIVSDTRAVDKMMEMKFLQEERLLDDKRCWKTRMQTDTLWIGKLALTPCNCVSCVHVFFAKQTLGYDNAMSTVKTTMYHAVACLNTTE